jgi:hypothetical protein
VSPDAHVNAYDGMKLIVSDDVPPSRLSAALSNAPNADYERVFPFEAKLADTLETARVSGGNAYHQNLGADAERNSDVRELLESLPDNPEGQQVARAIRDAYAGSFRNQAERAGGTSPEEPRDAVPTKVEPTPVTEKVASLPDGTLVKNSHKNGNPNTVQTFDNDRRRWGRSMTVAAGQGKTIIEELSNMSPEDRKVPEATAASYGHATGVCLMCGRALSSASSLRAGYGPECKGKMR